LKFLDFCDSRWSTPQAAYFLRKAGYSKISYVKGGIAQWGSDGLPLSDGAQEEEDGDSGSGKQWGLPELGFARRR
jgi:3-mercaptopyruvate sulfurtransferase SseA